MFPWQQPLSPHANQKAIVNGLMLICSVSYRCWCWNKWVIKRPICLIDAHYTVGSVCTSHLDAVLAMEKKKKENKQSTQTGIPGQYVSIIIWCTVQWGHISSLQKLICILVIKDFIEYVLFFVWQKFFKVPRSHIWKTKILLLERHNLDFYFIQINKKL